RVVVGPPELDLAQEALAELGIIEQRGERPLQRGQLVAPLGLEDGGHPALAQHLEETELAEPFLPDLVAPRARIDPGWRGGVGLMPSGAWRSLAETVWLLRPPQREPREHDDHTDRQQGERDESHARARRNRGHGG